jgi:prepilin-type N-terminal cleavage/methylation domain-containing protein
MKNNKGFSLVELIIVIAIMAILVGVMAPQLIKYIEKSKVSADTQLADTVHSALLTAMMDPEVVNNTNYNNEYSSYTNAKAVSTLSNSATTPIASSALEIMGVSNASDVDGSVKSTINGGDGKVSFMITTSNSVSVWIPGTDTTGSKGKGAAGTTSSIVIK